MTWSLTYVTPGFQIHTRVGRCWPWRTRQDMRMHKVAAGQRADSGRLRFLSTVSSAAEVTVLQGDSGQGGEDEGGAKSLKVWGLHTQQISNQHVNNNK